MDKATEHNSTQVARFLAVTPQQLRMIADRLELAATNAAERKDKVTYPVTQDIILYFDPVLKTKSITQPINEGRPAPLPVSGPGEG